MPSAYAIRTPVIVLHTLAAVVGGALWGGSSRV